MRPALTLAGVSAMVPSALLACEISTYEPGYAVPPASFGADCSFTIPGQVTYNTDLEGAPAVNVGGGRIGQRITRGFGCGWDEAIWIVDCNSGETVGVRGRPSDDMNQSLRADLLYPPHGALRLTAETTVAQIVALAQREGYDHVTDLSAFLSDLPRRTRPDPACGCALFYPDSALATQ